MKPKVTQIAARYLSYPYIASGVRHPVQSVYHQRNDPFLMHTGIKKMFSAAG